MSDELDYVSGWGGAPRARTHLIHASDDAEIRAAIEAEANGSRGVIPRGLGRSYGDAAQRSGGTTLTIHTDAGPEWVDRAKGIIRTPAGATIAELIEFAEPHGFFVPVTPGTRYVTVGGALAADIHGKDHHKTGALGTHVQTFRMLVADGQAVDVDRESDPELFRATVGGMGLTGVILDVVIRLMPVPGSRILVDTFRTPDLEATMTALADADDSHRYTVAWLDLAGGGSLGRGVVTNGDHTDARQEAPLRDSILGIPPIWRMGAVNTVSVRAFNEVWFRKAPRQLRQDIQSYDKFFYPLDVVRDWNRVYGRRGFLQYQLVLPFDSEGLLPRLAETLASAASPVSLAVLKRMGPESEGYLSFPMPGWTLTADFPIGGSPSRLEAVLRSVDETLVDVGGRVYLAKDSRMGADLVAAMYPQLDRFREVRDRVDPHRVFQSDLAVRLGL